MQKRCIMIEVNLLKHQPKISFKGLLDKRGCDVPKFAIPFISAGLTSDENK